MGHKANYTEKLKLIRGELYRVITAHYKNVDMEVVKHKLGSDDKYVRNIDLTSCSGWLFYAPNDRLMYSSDKIGVEKWYKCGCECNIVGTSEQSYDEIMLLLSNTEYAEFNYTLKYMKSKRTNYSVSILEIFNLLANWTKNKAVELLVKNDLCDLALNGSFLKLSKEKQKAVISIAQKYKGNNYVSYSDLLIMAKTNCPLELCMYGGDSKLKDYLLEQNESIVYYKDYVKMAKKLKKDMTDNYWKYPKDLVNAHNKVMEQYEAVLEAERLLKLEREQAKRNEKEAKENQYLSTKIKGIAKKLSSLNGVYGDYEISVAESLEDIKEQATKLSQCLMTCSYYKKYANKQCILVFVKQGKKRLATAEVFYDKEKPLGQFYGDERDRNNCLPNQSIKNAFNNWLNNTYLRSNLCCV